jgi:ATP-dependent DNA helicase RecG
VVDLMALNVLPAKKKQFASKGINTVEDLLNYLPRKYKDYSHYTGILPADQVSVFQVKVNSVQSKIGKVRFIVANCSEAQSGRTVYVRWFNCSWMYQRLASLTGKTVTIIGKVERSGDFGTYNVTQPEAFELIGGLGIYPVYSAIQGMSQDYLTGKIHDALGTSAANAEILPDDIIQTCVIDTNQYCLRLGMCPGVIYIRQTAAPVENSAFYCIQR